MDNILKIKNISKEFPGVRALGNINIEFQRGEIHAVVGENGAGKSTLMKILSGVYKPTSGEIFLNNEEKVFKDPKDAQASGISIIHQEFSLIPYLNGLDNIFLGRELRKPNGLLDKKKMMAEASKVMQRLDADINLSKVVSNLSVANQQFIEIAKAISTKTDVLIFDEPTASLTETEISKLFKLIKSLKDSGVTIIYISHHLDEIFEMCDRLTVLRDGNYVGTEVVSKTDKQEVVKMMVGRTIENQFPDRLNLSKDAIKLKVENIENENVTNIKFELKEGEVLGIAGLVGSGRTELIRALIGADKSKNKSVYIDNVKAEIRNPSDALSKGICLIPESRKTQGLVLDMSISKNISLPILNKFTNKFSVINKKKEKRIIDKSVEDLLIKTPNNNQLVRNLSGGNQQKVVLAKWLNTNSKIFIFDEPTRGIDIGAKEEIYKLIRELSENGISIIMISSELPEVIGLSDRIAVMHKGKIKKIINNIDVTQEKVMQIATGGV